MKSMKVTQAVDAAKQFARLYYETSDKNRTKLRGFYLDNASLVWNGNPVASFDDILAFLEQLPTSEHEITSLDSQPIDDAVTDGKTTIMVTALGTVKYPGQQMKSFHQTFVMTEQDKVWKIVSDVFRLQDSCCCDVASRGGGS